MNAFNGIDNGKYIPFRFLETHRMLFDCLEEFDRIAFNLAFELTPVLQLRLHGLVTPVPQQPVCSFTVVTVRFDLLRVTAQLLLILQLMLLLLHLFFISWFCSLWCYDLHRRFILAEVVFLFIPSK